MKKYLLSFAIACSIYTVKAQSNNETPYITKPLSGQGVQSVEVETSGGGITVKGGADGDARVEVYVRGNNNRTFTKEEIQQMLADNYELTVTVENHKVVAKARNKRNINDWRKALNIGFKIYVPVNVSTDLTTSGGGITLSNVTGTQKFETSGGGLQLDHLAGKVHGTTSGGGIHLSDSKDEIDLTTSGGGIEANNCTGNIRLETSGGGLHLFNLGGTVRATTSGGGAEGDNISGELAVHTSGGGVHLRNMSCSLDASTSGASIDVDITSLGKYVKLNNGGGNISLSIPSGKGIDLDLDGNRINTNRLDNFRGSQEEGRMKGTLNGGGIPVTVDAGGGKISLTMK